QTRRLAGPASDPPGPRPRLPRGATTRANCFPGPLYFRRGALYPAPQRLRERRGKMPVSKQTAAKAKLNDALNDVVEKAQLLVAAKNGKRLPAAVELRKAC